MSAKWKLILAVAVLFLAGGGIAAYKTNFLGVPFWRGEQIHDWQVEARVSFVATGRPVKARLALPTLATDRGATQESGSFGYHFNTEDNLGEVTAVWNSDKRDGVQALYFRVRFPESARSGGEPVAAASQTPESAPMLPGALGEATRSIIDGTKAVTTDPDSLFVAIFNQIRRGETTQEFGLVKRHFEAEFPNNAPIRMGIELLEMAGLPARIAYGVRLAEDLGGQAPVALVEYFDGASWKVRDPMDPGTVLDGREIFVWHRGGGPLLDVTGGENSRVSFTVARDRIPLARLTDLRNSPLFVSTILGLPLSERAVFRYILLIPLGAFVVVVMRNIIGVPTLGTFMPVLIALALLEIQPALGLAMFTVLIGAGLWFRFLLSRLNLLVVPRVAACVVIVTLLMVLISVVSYKLGFVFGRQITLFPMIILAWTIERMSLIWEEEGKVNALSQVAGSLVVAVAAYFCMQNPQIKYWSFYFPELMLVQLGCILLIGRYTGYRLSELIRFRNFADA